MWKPCKIPPISSSPPSGDADALYPMMKRNSFSERWIRGGPVWRTLFQTEVVCSNNDLAQWGVRLAKYLRALEFLRNTARHAKGASMDAYVMINTAAEEHTSISDYSSPRNTVTLVRFTGRKATGVSRTLGVDAIILVFTVLCGSPLLEQRSLKKLRLFGKRYQSAEHWIFGEILISSAH